MVPVRKFLEALRFTSMRCQIIKLTVTQRNKTPMFLADIYGRKLNSQVLCTWTCHLGHLFKMKSCLYFYLMDAWFNCLLKAFISCCVKHNHSWERWPCPKIILKDMFNSSNHELRPEVYTYSVWLML